MGSNATVYTNLCDGRGSSCIFDLNTLEDAREYIKHIAMYIKENYNKEQEVKTIQAQVS